MNVIAAHPGAAAIVIVIIGFALAAIILRWQDARRVIRQAQDDAEIDQAIANVKPGALRAAPKAEEPPFTADGLGDALRRITEGDRG